MALNKVPLNPGSGGADILVDTISGSDIQIVKFAVGAEGTATLVSTADPMPVQQIGDLNIDKSGLATSDNQDDQSALLSDIINNQATGNSTLSAIKSKTDNIPALGQALAAASVPVVLTASQLSTLTPLATVAVTGALTDAQLRASAVPISIAAPTTPYTNKVIVTTATTRVQLSSGLAVKSVTIKAGLSNTGIIYVGGSSVDSSNGFELAAGDSVSMDIANLNVIYIDASANSQYVTYFAVN